MLLQRKEPGQAQVGDGVYDWTGDEAVEIPDEQAELLLNSNPELYKKATKKAAEKEADGEADAQQAEGEAKPAQGTAKAK